MKTKTPTKAKKKCALCAGLMKQSLERLEEWHGDTLYVFENVLALRCEECGELWIEGKIAERLDELIKKSKPERIIQAPVFDLATA